MTVRGLYGKSLKFGLEIATGFWTVTSRCYLASAVDFKVVKVVNTGILSEI